MRTPAIDNAKALLIALVVFGHLIEGQLPESRLIRTLYLALYIFHVPAFAIVSGYLYRGKGTLKDWYDRNRELIVTFIVFELLFEGAIFLGTGRASEYLRSVQPYWHLWYLLSLILWRLFVNVTGSSFLAIACSLFAGCAIGCCEQGFLVGGISRTVVFFPFFLLGQHASKRGLNLCSGSLRIRMISALVLCALLPISQYLLNPYVGWSFGSHSYLSLGVSKEVGILVRVAFYAVSTATAVSLLRLVPDQTTPLETCGPNSLYVYAWHTVVVHLVCSTTFYHSVFAYSEYVFISAALASALVITKLLSQQVVATATQRVLIEPLLGRPSARQ